MGYDKSSAWLLTCMQPRRRQGTSLILETVTFHTAHILKGLSSEMEGGIKLVSIGRSPFKQGIAQQIFNIIIKAPVYNLY